MSDDAMDRRTVGQRALGGAGLVAAVSALQLVVGFMLQLVLARLLAPEVFGQFAFVLLVQGAVASLRTIQAGEFLVTRRDGWRAAYDTVFTTDLALSAATTALVIALADPVMRIAGEPALADVLRVTILGCVVMPFGIPGVVLQRHIDFASSAKARVGGILAGPVLKVALAWWGFGIWSLVAGELCRMVLEVLIVWRLAPERPSLAFDRATLFEALRFSLPLSASALLVYYYWKIDDFVVGRLLGMEALGHYWLAFRIPEYFMILRAQFHPVVFSAMARLDAAEDRAHAFGRLTRLTLLFSFPAALVALVHGDALIELLFGRRWMPAVPAFQMLMLAGALRMSTGFAGDLFKVGGHTWVFPVTSLFNASLLTAGVLALTGGAGITGTGIAVLAMVVLSLPLTEYFLRRFHGLSMLRLLVRPVAALAVCSFAGFAVRAQVPGMGIPAAAGSAVALVAFYLTLIALIDRDVVDDVRWVAARMI
jgi:O-antigen/teichoic acid export membrane protein